jgi:hypothetical protein
MSLGGVLRPNADLCFIGTAFSSAITRNREQKLVCAKDSGTTALGPKSYSSCFAIKQIHIPVEETAPTVVSVHRSRI